MARNTITDTPSLWHLMLMIFDEHPAGAMGTRDCHFRLQNGQQISAKIRGVIRPSSGQGGFWQLIGETNDLPHGYYYFTEGAFVAHIDPYKRTGYVDLELTSPCHSGSIGFWLAAGGYRVGHCNQCQAAVMRTNEAGDWVWTDAEIVRQDTQFHQSSRVRFMTDDSQELPEMSE